ncbi:MAG: divalent-cation tolerance protein CutA [Holosporales bacterium]|jgi:periplasmic divalent cation tolerance protein|nr:divalent-cation tolerance protein CutA [Holosporales bacterium]
MHNEFSVVLSTAQSKQQAELLCHKLLEQNLAACIQIHRTKSFYLWQGKIKQACEYCLIIKTKTNLFKKLSTVIKQHHTYDIPEIIQLPLTDGLKDYLNWMRGAKYGF